MANEDISAAAAVADEDLIEQAYEALDGGAGAKPSEVDFDAIENGPDAQKKSKWQKWKENFKRKGWILVFILPALIYVIIFCYVPMYGILAAFQDYMPGDQVIGKDTVWVGWDNFKTFFSNPNFPSYFVNTFLLCILGFIVGFPLPIIVALLLNSVRPKKVKKGLQILYYAPHFISLVVLVGMMKFMFGSEGLLDNLSKNMGGNGIDLFLKEGAFRPLFIFSGNWQDFGWSAKVDGASRFRRIFSVDLPAILPTIVMLMILSVGNLMSCGYEKVLLMQTDGNIEKSEILSTYVYNFGLIGGQYGLGTAAGLFNSVINVVLLIIANFTSKKLSGNSMW